MVDDLLARARAVKPRTVDLALGVGLAFAAVAELAAQQGFSLTGWSALAYVFALLQTLALATRRTQPGLAMMVSGSAGLAMGVADVASTFAGVFGIMVALYSVAAHGTEHDAKVSGVITAVALAIIAVSLRDVLGLSDIVANYVLFGTAWVLGFATRNRRLLLAELEMRSIEAERARRAEARRAVAEERARIARELHDVVAHSVSVMVVQTGAARRLLDTQPEQARGSLETIEETGRSALSELRRVVGILRSEAGDEPASRESQPTLDDLQLLVAAVRAAGVPVRLDVTGEPSSLPPGVGVSAYRIVQEALTNVLKHAGITTRVDVRIHRSAEELEVEVVDDGIGAAAGKPGEGHGLVGMRERALLYGGALEAGPLSSGGFRVRARLPLLPRRSAVG